MQENENIETNIDVAAVEDQDQAAEVKKFTQEEVNELIKKRLEREKKKWQKSAGAAAPDDDLQAKLKEREDALAKREQDILAREQAYSKKLCADYLKDNFLPESLLDDFDHSDPDAFVKKIESMKAVFQPKKTPEYKQSEKTSLGDGFAKKPHVPRKY